MNPLFHGVNRYTVGRFSVVKMAIIGLSLLFVLLALPVPHAHAEEQNATQKEVGGVYKYVCPMHPQIVRDHEGTCPICGMDLVKQLISDSTENATIAISAGQGSAGASGLQQQFAIRTVRVQQQTLWKYIPTFGRVVADETKVVHIHPRASGWISDLSVRNNGDFITAGALLYRIYSPEIVSAQDDYIQVRQNRSRLGPQAKSLMESARLRLELLGLNDKTIDAIAKQGMPMHQVPIYAPQSGYVNDLKVQNGMYVQPNTELMSLTNLDSVWVEAEVLPLQQDWLKPDLTVDIKTDAYPGKNWESFISYIYPTADNISKAVKVRIPVDNQNQQLKLNSLVDVAIYGGPKRDVLAIPLEAVIDDGREQRVVVQNADGQFSVKPVVLGMQTQGLVEILSGVEANDKVVVSGQFMIDSESQIQSNLRRLMSASTNSTPASEESGFEAMPMDVQSVDSIDMQSMPATEHNDSTDHSNH